MAEAKFANGRHHKGLDIFRELEKPVSVSVDTKLTYAYERDMLNFFMKKGRDAPVSRDQMYDEVFPKRSGDDFLMIERTLTDMTYKGILWPTLTGCGVEYPKKSGRIQRGYRINPDIKVQ